MSDVKHISKSGYKWGHFGAIMADTVVFLIIAYFAFKIGNKIKILRVSNENGSLKKSISYKLNWILGLSLVFALVTLLGLIPIFKNYDEIKIS